MSKLIGMVNKNTKTVNYILIIAFVLVIVSMLFVNRGTYSVDENVNSDNIVLDCPDSASVGGSIECSINVNLVTMTAYGINAKYNIPKGVEFVDFTSENWDIYSNDEDGFVLVNLDGVVGNASVGVVKFTIPADALPKEIYKIELTDISLGDGEETVLNLDNVSDEFRIKSNINTLNSISISDVTLNESFDKDKVEYTGKTSADKIKIEVVKTDEYSVVSGDIGEKAIHYGTNKFSIVVTSEDGNTKSYSIEIYKEYKFSTDKYVYNETSNYLYVGDGGGLISNIDIPEELSKEVKDNKLIISYKDEVLKEIDLIIVSSDVYDLDKEYIYLGTEKLDVSKISIINGQVTEEDNKLLVKYNDNIIDEFVLVSVDLGNLYVDNSVITLDDYLSYEEFVNNIKGNVSYNIFNDNKEVKDGDITEEMVLKLYYEGVELDSFDINVYNLSFNNSIIVDEDNKYIKFKKVKSSIGEFLTNLDVVGDVRIFVSDKYGNEKNDNELVVTGDTLTIFVGSEKQSEYKIAVRGDSNGDGKVSLTDLVQLRKHIVGWKNPETGLVENKTGVYFYAMDMNNDGNISLTDLVRVRKVLVGIDIDEEN